MVPPTSTASATPLRRLGAPAGEGCVVLREPTLEYRDGGEQRVREIILASDDLSSISAGMARQAQSWAETYHLDPARSNVLRVLDLPPDARVLEVGAGCGAITRYLGENCAVVDALEPMPERAAAARDRTRDLPGVAVFVGTVEDVPAEPAYDLVVVVGVLEYVGSGSADPQPYRDFLCRIADLLHPDGTLVLAIENKLGVKYLCGAPEDHSGRTYDSVEGYPFGSRARTFSRTELSGLLTEAGLTSRSLIAFPDYKLTRAVFDPGVLAAPADSLLYRVPNFPSSDYLAARAPGGPAESRVWRSLVMAGLAGETGNSFLVLASRADLTALWPEHRAGVFFGTNRQPAYAMRTEIVRRDDSVRLERSFLVPDIARDNPLGLDVHAISSTFLPGTDLLDELTDTTDPRTVGLLTDWRDLVRRSTTGSTAPYDLIPRNLVLRPDGGLAIVDQEWTSDRIDADFVLRRGAMLTAMHLWVAGRLPGHWAGCATVADVARSVATVVGPNWDAGWLDQAVDAEAQFQAAVSVVPGALDAEHHEQQAQEFLRSVMNAPVPQVPEGGTGGSGELEVVRSLYRTQQALTDLTAEHQQAQAVIGDLTGELQATRATVERLTAELDRTRGLAESHSRSRQLQVERAEAELARAQQALAELESVRATLSWRVTAPLRQLRTRLPR
jgi:SAM-dependent methyltransferase